MIKELSVFLMVILLSWNCYSQNDTTNFKLDLGNPLFNENKYHVPKGNLNRLSPDSTIVFINGKFYHTREIDRLSDQELVRLDKNIESVTVEQNREAIDSIMCNRIKSIIIIRLKDSKK